MAPDEYLLMRNMSLIYISLEYAKNKINEWYEQIKNKKSMRYVMLHGNLETSHFLEGDNAYLISWDQARRDLHIMAADGINQINRLCRSYDMEPILNFL